MTDAPFPPSSGARGAPVATTYSGPSLSTIPRRSSYASVLSGTALSPPSNSGPFSQLLTSNSTSYPPPFHSDGRHLRPSADLDADMQMNSPWRMSSGDTLPPYSRKYASFTRSDPFSQNPGSFSDVASSSFTPSYLRNSRYISRLDAARRAKLASQRDAIYSSSTSNPISTSSSQASLPRITPSHRGMTYDIIEREPPGDDEHVMPLPSQWNDGDKYSGLELTNEGLEVRYTGPVNKHDHEAAACGIYYFEITILSKPKEGMIGIGFSSNKASVERLPGWEQESWAYHGDDGKSFFGESQGQGRQYGPTFGVNDTVGCGVNFSTGCAFFTKNGVFLGNAFRELRNLKVYPSVGMKKQPPVHLAANFGQHPFMFDIDGMVKKEKFAIHSEIRATSTANLQPPLDESALLQELVAQFLAHDGYVETARAFAEEVAAESAALQNGRTEPLKKYEVEEDVEAINRQKIRAAILDGDIDKALKYTNAYYANVLQNFPHIHFKLRCRKFLEMMRRCNEPSWAASKREKSSNGLADGSAVFDEEMELDEQMHHGGGWNADGMDTEEPENAAKFNELLTEAVQYGQQLRLDYPNDERGGNKKMLDDIFSLVAYPDPKQSVHGHYLDPAGRIAVAEELNSAILVSLGKSSSAALERLYQQTEVLVNEISEEGGAGAFINVPCIPTHSSSTPTALRCCCGRNDCTFLQHNNLALEGLEKDLATAARLGQALLHRHESYMAEAEEDRRRFLTSIENLEREKREVQVENARIIEENRGLLEQLDALNKAVADADSHTKSLEVRLEHSEAELRKVTVSAARAADLDAQLVQMENEQSKLHESLESAEEESKSAVQRWKKAESTLRDLHDQIDRIEKEAREERERHTEAVQRMERKRTVERELDGAARRLKGAAATHDLGRSHGGTVVSRFVRDILQDNANLQLGIVELRELLESSNQEVQCLRDQIISHQLVPMTEGDGQVPQLAPTLSQELESKEPRRAPQEFHIHHHYHTPAIKKERPTLFRRSKNRHTWGHPNTVHSPSGTKLARKPTHRSQSSHSSASTMMSQPPVQIPSASQRWSSQSPGAESIASSPQSGYRSSSIFDRVERGFDSSRATSPDSTAFSPLMVSRRRSSFYDASFRSPETNISVDPMDDSVFNKGLGDAYQPVIPEEREDSVHYATSERAFSPAPDDVFASPYSSRRKQSHESLFSVAGMDIHTPSRRPSRMEDISTPYSARVPRRIFSSNDRFSNPVLSTSTVTANREPSKIDQSSQTLLASMAASRHSETGSATSGHSDPTGTPTRKISLTRRVGGWMREHLGNTPTTAIGDTKPHQEQPRPSTSQVSPDMTPPSAANRKPNPKADTVPSLRYRYPGVNQEGPIMGFRPTSRAPFAIHAEAIDEGLLRETLAE
ncbi:CTLH/CRA C-terminal to lish motif domain-containing protein [Aspergillus tamarii]|uniref:Protein FYV10 n=1 Tax=Aspergillus tamarii TaxID=41984 RepID=A0A5N6V7F8_ASPTM|nr:CTLH/CRA C-terminal to lish motif domain-containing protein [Aspergillus tamarii]